MSALLEDARRDLVRGGLITSLGALEPDGELGDLAFRCELPAPHPNSEGLPARVPVKVRLPARFPLSKVEFILTDPAMWGFPHQDGRTGAMCLKSEDEYPFEPSARLQAYVADAIAWLHEAANGTLLSPGQRWELPDFRVERRDAPPSVLAIEDEHTFGIWADRIGQHGVVQLTSHAHRAGLIPTRFERAGEILLEPKISEGFLDRHGGVLGAWLLLPSHIFIRHRPARAFAELEAQCRAAGVDLWSAVHGATKAIPYKGYHYILVGAPIQEWVGGSPVVVHWQPIAIPSASVQQFGEGKPNRHPQRDNSRPKSTRRARLTGLLSKQAVPWGESITYPESRAEARGSLVQSAKVARIVLLGCGALGSPIAEHLAQGGSRSLSLFDGQVLDLENTSRHRLGPLEVGQSKAGALARRLNGIHPGAQVQGFLLELPPPPVPKRRDRLAGGLLERAEVLIDCTTSRAAFLWASSLGRDQGKLVIHMFVNAGATMLTICVSGQHVSCEKVAGGLFRDIATGATGFGVEEYEGEGKLVEPGAGCWQSTFPARGSDIAVLAAAAVPIIEEAIRRGRSSRGAAFVLRRRRVNAGAANLVESIPAGLIEVAWKKAYR